MKVDRAIAKLRAEDDTDPTIAIIEPERAELQARLEELNSEIDVMGNLAKGNSRKADNLSIAERLTKGLKPGRFKNIRRLAAAITALLMTTPKVARTRNRIDERLAVFRDDRPHQERQG